MEIITTAIPEVKVIQPKIFKDQRGYFFESFNQQIFDEKIGNIKFVQDNESMSSYGVVRGLHYQMPPMAQAKLVRVIKGKVLDVAVDIRKESPTFGKYVAVELSEENKKMMFIPHGFAHGFAVLSDFTVFTYKVDNYYSPMDERSINPFDESLAIDWKIPTPEIIMSEKDKAACSFSNADFF